VHDQRAVLGRRGLRRGLGLAPDLAQELPPAGAFEGGGQLLVADGLDEVVACVKLEGLESVAAVGGGKNKRQVTEPPGHLEAVAAGDAHVEQHDARGEAPGL